MPPTEYFARAEDLTEIADAIREKGDTSASLSFPDGFISAINDIDPSRVIDRIERIIDGNNSITHWENLTVTTIGSYVFAYCDALQSVYFPNCTAIYGFAFYQCTALQTVSFPKCTMIGSHAFQNCNSLQIVSFPKCSDIEGLAFYSCKSLQSVYLLSSSVVNLRSTAVFLNTPISDSTYLGYFGSIFVPASLVSQYKTYGNWTVYANRFVGV